MMDLPVMWAVPWEWLGLAIRWLHVVTAIAWIGSSFYFVALDLGLDRNLRGPADGEQWQVHGGGFYHIRKYLVAPDAMPEHLIWFKWEAYSTWLSGAALLMVVYWAGAELMLIDPQKADLTVTGAIAISALSLAAGWLVYDGLCRSPLGRRPGLLMLLLFVLLTAMSWGYHQVFTGRAAMLHLGAFTATIMSANVFFVIMPNQRIVVADLKAGRRPDPRYGRIAKLRSTHNNYLTLPVVFLMLSNHYPLAFASEASWLVAALVFGMGAAIRHWFNTRHARAGNPAWALGVAAALFVVIVLLTLPRPLPQEQVASDDVMPRSAARFADAPGFEDAQEIVLTRCSMCHSETPLWPGMLHPPRGIALETPEQVAGAAREIYLQAAVTSAMPPANITDLPARERETLRRWYEAGRLR